MQNNFDLSNVNEIYKYRRAIRIVFVYTLHFLNQSNTNIISCHAERVLSN